jgi:hypothetical protein
MLPGGILNVAGPIATFQAAPRGDLYTPLTSYELGGIALENTSEGLFYQLWTCYVPNSTTGQVYLDAPSLEAPIVILTIPGIQQVSLTFDQNMHPFIAYQTSAGSFFYWYDPLTGQFTTTELESGATTPRCSLDDKRLDATLDGTNDILLFYIVAGNLYYRQEREQYATIHNINPTLASQIQSAEIVDVGMNVNWYFQVKIRGTFAI